MNPLIAKQILKSGRSWWQARYYGGKVLSEWETSRSKVLAPSLEAALSSRWEDIPKDNLIAVRLLCPNGMAAEIEAQHPGAQFFQLKVGTAGVGGDRSIVAHVIGIVKNSNGDCHCRAWNYRYSRIDTFDANVNLIKYEGIGRLHLGHVGVA